jgi:RNA polymerase sigma factor (sigma-70 family)
MSGPTSQLGDGLPAAEWTAELERHRRWVRTVLFARTRDAAVVDDLWQQVALAAVRQADPGAVANMAPWLYRVALRQVLQHRRQCGRERRRTLTYDEHRHAERGEESAEADPLGWLLADEQRRLVRQAVRELDPQDAELLMLKYTEDWTYHQIGEHLGLSQSAVESRLFRARTRLRKELAALAEPADVSARTS